MTEYKISEQKNARLLWKDARTRVRFDGLFADAEDFLDKHQIKKAELWKKFVEQFREHSDSEDARWRCEYWGKMMRGAVMMLEYSQDSELYAILEDSVRDMLGASDADGRISTYRRGEEEFRGWDMWGRKYVILGMQYFLDVCKDEALEKELLESMRRQADCIIEHIGKGEGNKDIRDTTNHWEGMNSCSILEPIVRLYRLTGEKRYLDFAEYIISTGFIKSANLIGLAAENKLSPYEYPVVKAYEMMSCFEGLLQYDCLFENRPYKQAILNFGYKILQNELSIIGCAGCTHELFDNTSLRQTQTDYEGVVQETCVSVTWMKLASALLEISGDSAFADSIENTFYNAYLGSLNTYLIPTLMETKNKPPKEMPVPTVLPFDSYSPLVTGERGRKVGGYNVLSDGTTYGCCACIGAAGLGSIPRSALMHTKNGITLNYYENGEFETVTPSGQALVLDIDTAYPFDGRIDITLAIAENENFELALRIPAWCEGATVSVGGKTVSAKDGYFRIVREWTDGESVALVLPMPVRRVFPPKGAENEDIFAAYCRGPIVLAADRRIAEPTEKLAVKCAGEIAANVSLADCPEIPDCNICLELETEDGARVRLIDYASAGKTWDEKSLCAAWLYR